MKRFFLIFFGSIIFSNYAASQYNLEIEIIEIRNDVGNIMLQFFDENEEVIIQEMSAITDNKCLLTIKNLEPGKYGIRYYHDENLNGEMETNFLGIPKEGFGFSNNVTGTFGPPPFKKWLFDIKEDKKIVLMPLYLD